MEGREVWEEEDDRRMKRMEDGGGWEKNVRMRRMGDRGGGRRKRTKEEEKDQGGQYGGEWSQFQLRRPKASASFLTLILRPPVFLMQMCLT